MRSHAVTMPPISIFITNLLLIALTASKLIAGIDSSAEALIVEHQGEFPSMSDIFSALQISLPKLSLALTAILLMISSSVISRLSTNNMLYGIRSLTASPLQMIVVCSLLTPTNSLYISLISLLATLAIYYSYKNVGMNQRIKEMLYSGLITGSIILLAPFSMVVIAIIVLLRRTRREELIAILAIPFSLFIYLYYHWFIGYEFIPPLIELYNENVELFINGFQAPEIKSILHLVPVAAIALLLPVGSLSLTTSKYHRDSQSRLILMLIFILISVVLIIIGGELLTTIAICSAAISLLANRGLVEMRRGLSSVIYSVVLIVFIASQIFF